MLENSQLWIEPEAPDVDLTAPRCSLLVRSVRGGPLVGRITVQPLPWLPWRVRWRMTADEGGDRSLLFTARRAGWLPRDWDVQDADGRFVALWRGSRLLSPDGRAVGRRAAGSPRVWSLANQTWAEWRRQDSGLRIEFGPELDEPFLRMAIIVASLIDPPART